MRCQLAQEEGVESRLSLLLFLCCRVGGSCRSRRPLQLKPRLLFLHLQIILALGSSLWLQQPLVRLAQLLSQLLEKAFLMLSIPCQVQYLLLKHLALLKLPLMLACWTIDQLLNLHSDQLPKVVNLSLLFAGLQMPHPLILYDFHPMQLALHLTPCRRSLLLSQLKLDLTFAMKVNLLLKTSHSPVAISF